MSASLQLQRPQVLAAAPAPNGDPEVTAITANHRDSNSLRTSTGNNSNNFEAERASKRPPRRSPPVNMPLSARASDNPRQANDLSSHSLMMKTNRLQHTLIDAQHLRSSDTHTAEVNEVLQAGQQQTNLKHIYNRIIVAESGSKSSFLSPDELLFARKATQLTIAKMRAIAMDPLILERLMSALSCELPHSFASPLKRLERDARCYYAFGKIVGKGTFGRVYSAQHRLSDTQVAIKSYFRETGAAMCCRPPISHINGSSSRTMSKQQPSTRQVPPMTVPKRHNEDNSSDILDWKRVRQEVKMMSALQPHPSIIQFIEAFETPTQMHVVMEFVSGETICDYMRRTSPNSLRLSESKARGIFTQVCGAVSSLHDQDVIHRDLKLENVLIDKRGRAKVIDFGFSQFDYSSSDSNSRFSGPDETAKNFCGTPAYMAPEVVSCKSYDGKRVDVWSLGVILYVLLCGKFPFQAQSFHQLYQSIRSSSALSQRPFPPGLSKDAQNLVRSVLVADPIKRPRVRDILMHPWMTRTGDTKGDEDGEPSERQELEATKKASRGTIDGDRRFFVAFLQWEEAQTLFCEALEQIYGLSGTELKFALQSKRRNGVTAFVRLMLLTVEKQCAMLAATWSQSGSGKNNTISVEPPELPGSDVVDASATSSGESHKQHLEKLIGLVKASLTV